jgi:hypothetical protein
MSGSDSGRLASQHWYSEYLKSCIENALFEAYAQWKVVEGVGVMQLHAINMDRFRQDIKSIK